MTEELPPVRCYTCGKVIGHKWNTYQKLLSSGVSIEDALNRVGLVRYCCKLRLRNPFRTIINMDRQQPQVELSKDLVTTNRGLNTNPVAPLDAMKNPSKTTVVPSLSSTGELPVPKISLSTGQSIGEPGKPNIQTRFDAW